MKTFFFIFINLIFLLPYGIAQDRANLQKQIDKIILYDTEISFSKTPGMLIGVKVQDSVFFFGYGSTSKDTLIAPDEKTIFEIGGLTKVFTSSLVSVLESEGKIKYDQSYNNYLPKKLINESSDKITLEKLLTHTSGMPRMPFEFGVRELEQNNPYAHYSQKDLMDFYKEFFPLPEKKSKKTKVKKNKSNYLYSHVNYALLEIAIENVAQKKYENLLLEKILKPLQLSDTRIQLTADQKSKMAIGYSLSGKATPPWTFSSFGASEGLKSTGQDLMRFAEVQMGKRAPEFSAVFEKTHEPFFKTGLNKVVWTARGWHVIKNKKYYDVVAHSGNTNGFRSFLSFVKETETAVLVLTNSEHDLEGVGYLILQMINNYWQKW